MSVTFKLIRKKPSQKAGYLQVIVAYKGKYYRRSSGENVPANKWNHKAQKCLTSGFERGEAVNARLKKLRNACEDACDFFIQREQVPQSVDFWKQVDQILTGRIITRKKVSFTEYFELYIQRISPMKAVSTVKSYVTTYNKLIDYENHIGTKLLFEDIKLKFYKDFQDYIYSLNLSENYFGTLIKCIKVVYREARDVDQIHDLYAVDQRGFKVINETADSIYLSEEELLKIHWLNITEELVRAKLGMKDERPQNIARKLKSLEISRAKFLIGAFTALRVSDFNRLSDINLQGDYITITTVKTLEPVVIPIHWVIREILERGFDINTPISDQKLNKHIKEVARLADITSPVEITTVQGGKPHRKVYEKWEKVTTHTCRRSGATNMVKYGLPHLSIMKITGHKSWKSFTKYVKVSGEENAQLLKKSGFFDKPEARSEED